MIIASVIVLCVPACKILSRAGYSITWAVLLFVPIINIVAIWIFAFSRWRVLELADDEKSAG
jgi:hypothetical protein